MSAPKAYAPLNAPNGGQPAAPPAAPPVLRAIQYGHAIVVAMTTIIFGMFPGAVSLLPGQSELAKDEKWLGEFQCLMAITFPLVIVHLHSAMKAELNLIMTSIVWRFLWLTPWVLACIVGTGVALGVVMILWILGMGGATLAMIPEKGAMASTMVRMLRPPFSSEYHGSIGDVMVHTFGLLGILLTLMTSVGCASQAHFIGGEFPSSIGTLALATPAVYGFLMIWISHHNSHTSQMGGIAALSAVVVALFSWGNLDVLPYQVVQAYIAFGCLALGTLTFTTVWQALVIPTDRTEGKMGPGTFMVGVAAFMAIEATLFCSFRSMYSEACQEISWRIGREESETATLIAITGFVSILMEQKGPLNKWAYYISWGHCWINIWFVLEGKYICHSGAGNPMKKSWTALGLVDLYAKNEAANFTYWQAGLQTGNFNTAAMIFIYLYSDPQGWSRLSRHGAMMLINCGWFFGFMFAGVAPGCKAWGPAYDTPAMFKHQDYMAGLSMHRLDAVLSLVLMAGGILFHKVMPKETEPMAIVVLVCAWALAIVPKLQYIYYESQGMMKPA